MKDEEEKEEKRKEERTHESSSSLVAGSLGSKHVMKEYVVGAEKKERKKERKEKPKVGKELKLSHLDEEDGEEEED